MTARAAPLAPAAARADWPWLQSAIDMAPFPGVRWPADSALPGARWSPLPRVATRTPALTPHSVTTARAFTLRTMLRWGVADRSHDVAGVVSELLTNALRHALPDEHALPQEHAVPLEHALPQEHAPLQEGAAAWRPARAGSGLACYAPGMACCARSPIRAPRHPYSASRTGWTSRAAVSSWSHRSARAGATARRRTSRARWCGRRSRPPAGRSQTSISPLRPAAVAAVPASHGPTHRRRRWLPPRLPARQAVSRTAWSAGAAAARSALPAPRAG